MVKLVCFDLDLTKKQKLLSASAFDYTFKRLQRFIITRQPDKRPIASTSSITTAGVTFLKWAFNQSPRSVCSLLPCVPVERAYSAVSRCTCIGNCIARLDLRPE